MARTRHSRRAALSSWRLRLAARAALLLEVAGIAWLASFGPVQQAQIQSVILGGDQAASLASRSPVWSALALSAVAAGVELLQAFVPGRTASVLDLVASLAGVAAGLSLGAALWPILLGRSSRR